MNAIIKACLHLAFLSLAVIATASAQTQRTGDNNARAMQQVQQLTAERVQLKAENDKLKQELESVKKQLTAATSEHSSLQQRLKVAESTASRESASTQQNTEALEKTRAQLQELIGRFRETATSLKEVETDRNTVRGQLQSRERELNTCVERNVALYELNNDVLNRLEHKGVWSSLTEREPFTQIQRTRLENLIDDYRQRASELHKASASN
jgi:cell division septum initiation protein DivIVA